MDTSDMTESLMDRRTQSDDSAERLDSAPSPVLMESREYNSDAYETSINY